MVKKRYDEQPEQEPMMVNEPSSIYAANYQTEFFVSGEDHNKKQKSLPERKAEFVRAVLNDMDEETFNNLETWFYIQQKCPADLSFACSADQMRKDVDLSVQQIKEGKYLTDEELESFVLL